jgi:ribonuclease VapC
VTTALDTSAVAAVVLGEPDAEALLSFMLADVGSLLLSAATRVEVGIVVEARQGHEATNDLRILLDRLGVEIVPVDVVHVEAALSAWNRFGKGRHPAGLNLGDCLTYALAKVSGASLLYKGQDFRQTDVVSAV